MESVRHTTDHQSLPPRGVWRRTDPATVCRHDGTIYLLLKGFTMLRNMQELKSYSIGATDGDVGRVVDVFFDDHSWVVRYLVVDTSNWWMGHKGLAPPEWISNANWADASVTVNLAREAVQNSRRYESSEHLIRSHELELYSHYGRPTCWDREHARQTVPTKLLD